MVNITLMESMRMDKVLTNTYYGLWQVIKNGDEPVQKTKNKNGVETEVPPKTTQALLQRQKERKAKIIMLLAIPDEYQLRMPILPGIVNTKKSMEQEWRYRAYTLNTLRDLTQSLESVKATNNVHQKMKLSYDENIAVLEFEVTDKWIRMIPCLKAYRANKTSASWSYRLKIGFNGSDERINFQYYDCQTTIKPSFKRIEFTKAMNEPVKSDKQVVKPRMVTQSPKKMPKESVLRKGTGHKEVRPIWNNTQRINHQNKFVPTVVLTRVSKEKVNTVRVNGVNTAGQTTVSTVKGNGGNPQQALKYKGMFDSGCSRHMTGNKALLTNYQHIDGGFVALVKVLEVMKVQVLILRVPGINNSTAVDLKNVVPSGDLTCLFAKATIDESKLLHRRLGHVNFKIINKLVKGNLVRCLPSKTFENDHTCVACQKGKQHKASSIPKAQIIRDPKSAVQTRGMTKKNSGEHAMISYIQKQRRTNHKDFQNCLFACFLSQHEPTKISQALDDESWVEAMQIGACISFKIQKVWTIDDLPSDGSTRNKQEEDIDYDEVFAPVARGVYVSQPPGKRGWGTKIPQSGGPPIKVGDEVVHKELGDIMERAATTVSSFEA
ncbi:ribonuclease H-like domain-containing protein [Tanacetum coccineum]